MASKLLLELRVEVASTRVTLTGEDGGEEEVSIVDNNSLGEQAYPEQ